MSKEELIKKLKQSFIHTVRRVKNTPYDKTQSLALLTVYYLTILDTAIKAALEPPMEKK